MQFLTDCTATFELVFFKRTQPAFIQNEVPTENLSLGAFPLQLAWIRPCGRSLGAYISFHPLDPERHSFLQHENESMCNGVESVTGKCGKMDSLEDAPLITSSAPSQGRQPSGEGGRTGLSAWHPMFLFNFLWNHGPLCVMLAETDHAFTTLIVKLLVDRIPVFQVIFVRSFGSLVVLLILGIWKGVTPLFGEKKHWFVLFVRSALAATGMTLTTYALYFIPMGDTSALYQLMVFYVVVYALMSRIEPVNGLMISGALFCLIGGVLVGQPPFLFGDHTKWDMTKVVGMSMAAVAPMFAAAQNVCVGWFGRSTHTITMIIWMHSICSLSALPMLIAGFPSPAVLLPGRHEILLLGAIVCTAVTRQFLLTRGVQISNATVGTSVAMVGVLVSYLLGYFVLDETLSILAGIGALCVIVGVMLVAKGKATVKKMALAGSPVDEGYSEIIDVE
ncbi:hypothetical protein BSKO_08401 [Bryopsis sp. KO-2023]|nr:hypothetical protein BSKO_08401 [Bryopsis sp. KO-2023]